MRLSLVGIAQSFPRSLATPLLALTMTFGFTACGGPAKPAKVLKAPVLPPVNPKALQQFDSAMRAISLGGPEANEKAMGRFKEAVEIDDKIWEAWHNIGAILLSDGDSDGAIGAFTKALKINPVHRAALSGRAEAYRLEGKPKKAARDYRQLIEIDPNSGSVYSRLAALLRENQEFDEALDVLREGLRVNGTGSTIFVELGLVYLGQGRDELAKLVLNKSLSINDKDPSVFNALALIAIGEGDDQQAFAFFDKAAELDPKYIDARFNKASILLDAGDYNRAKAELESIMAFNNEDYDTQVALGIANRGLGAHKEARTLWEGVAKAAPRKSNSRLDALFNLAVLELDFIMDDKKAVAALDRYLQFSSKRHSKHSEAMELRKEMGQ